MPLLTKQSLPLASWPLTQTSPVDPPTVLTCSSLGVAAQNIHQLFFGLKLTGWVDSVHFWIVATGYRGSVPRHTFPLQ